MNLVFDFGGVLFSWQPVELVAKAFPECHRQQAEDLAAALFGHADWVDFDRGVWSVRQVVDRARVRLGVDADALTGLIAGIGDQLTPVEPVLALLSQWCQRREEGQAVRLYYLSNMSPSYARTLERKYDFLQWFDGGMFSGDVHLVKPEPEIYHCLQNRYALDPAATLLVDDVTGNVESARKLGWQGVVFQDVGQVATELAEYFHRWMD